MSIPFYDFGRLHDDHFKKQIKEIFSKIIDDGSFVEGPFNKKFEERFAQMQGAHFCRLVGNGTDALEIALNVYGVGPGDNVGVPGITFYASAEAVLNVGANVIHIDVDPTTGLMDPDSLKRVAKAHKLKAIIPVHIFGLPADIVAIQEICHEKGIKIIEDAAQAQGAILPTGPVGSTRNLVTFSFYPTKNLSAFGDAGAILCQNEEEAQVIEAIRNHGRGNTMIYGRNSRCDHLQAAVLFQKLDNIDALNEKRRQVAKTYFDLLKESEVKLLPKKFLDTSSWHLFPVRLQSAEERISLQHFLKAKNVATSPFYEQAISQDRAVANCPGENDNARSMAGTTLCLPINPFVSREDVNFIAMAIGEFYKS